MPTAIERPVFSEGQYLGAADLNGGVDYLRGQQARHLRTAHTWGILDGLTLDLVSPDTVAVRAGAASDSSGATVVVPADAFVSTGDFTTQGTPKDAKDDALYPLFLVGTPLRRPGNGLAGRCGAGQAGRIQEGYRFEFAGTAAANGWDDQIPPAAADGPDDSGGRRILLGFVHNKGGKFLGTATQNDDGVRPRYAGVQANEVVGPRGEVAIRSAKARTAGAPVLVLAPADDPASAAVLALDNGKGVARPALAKFGRDGTLELLGGLKTPAVPPGTTAVESGQATHGLTLPLPGGVDAGQVAAHVILTPRPDLSAKPPDATKTYRPLTAECHVDDARRVRCLLPWLEIDSAGKTGPVIVLPGVCDYLIVINTPAGGASQ
jgi:hypothetical protein